MVSLLSFCVAIERRLSGLVHLITVSTFVVTQSLLGKLASILFLYVSLHSFRSANWWGLDNWWTAGVEKDFEFLLSRENDIFRRAAICRRVTRPGGEMRYFSSALDRRLAALRWHAVWEKRLPTATETEAGALFYAYLWAGARIRQGVPTLQGRTRCLLPWPCSVPTESLVLGRRAGHLARIVGPWPCPCASSRTYAASFLSCFIFILLIDCEYPMLFAGALTEHT